MKVIRTLVNEPFCWTPKQARKITDYQFYELIIKPAIMRNRNRDGKFADVRGSRKKKRMPTKEEYVVGGVMLGGIKADLEAAYDRWLASKGNKNATATNDSTKNPG